MTVFFLYHFTFVCSLSFIHATVGVLGSASRRTFNFTFNFNFNFALQHTTVFKKR